MPDTTVKYFDSTMSGAPTLSNVAGYLIGVLDACLVNGFGSVTLDSLVVASNVATGTLSTGHSFAMIGATGPVIKIAGATPSGLNGEWRLASVPTANTFTFATTGISDQTATGTITAQRAPAGFSKAFSGTNKAAYRSDNIQGTRLYCRIDDSTTTYSRIRGYETLSDVDTGAGLFPTDAQLSGGGYVYKATGANRPWTLVSDGRLVYFFCDSTATDEWRGGFTFGDFNSYAGVDAFGCMIIASGTSSGTYTLQSVNTTPTTAFFARSYRQLDGSVTMGRYTHGTSTHLGYGGTAYPSVVDNSLHLWLVECWEGSTLPRGLLPGLWNPVHSGLNHAILFEGIPLLPGRTLLSQNTGSLSYCGVMDLTGPWR